ncbi:STT3 domain-containing protein [Nitrosophilus alvini]|uniref:STT3 domain-containing protein n=1 Tax=Nitrosophilus alvini TaxID=2714855 RepID=UPI001F157EA7|nr:STT3 domain-containing protein [Nitrosophilus alvini]
MFNFGYENVTKRELILLISIAYIISIIFRYYWIYWASGFPEFFWNNQIMINTNDGYFFASGVQKALFGMHEYNPLVPEWYKRGLVFVTAALSKLLPFSLETILLYMPGLISSLIVVPMILIGRLYNITWVGFMAAIFASVAWSYYNRTMFGYYDTDMFSVAVLMFIFYFLLSSIKKKDPKQAFWAALTSCIYPFLYSPGINVLYGLVVVYTIYIFIFYRKEKFFYPSITMLYASLFPLYFLFKLIILPILFILIKKELIPQKYEKYIAIGSIVIFFAWSGALVQIWQKVSAYFLKHGTETEGLHFYKVMQTIREASGIPFETLANRISGHLITFTIAMAGYLLLLFKERTFWLSIILVGLGLSAITGGLRFTIYAVPFLAFSLAYLFWVALFWIKNEILKKVLTLSFCAFALIPNIMHIVEYRVPTVFMKKEVEVLDRLKSTGSSKDFVITWWDYGYPIWFYAEKCTLIDGGKHHHDNFIVSEILSTDSQLEAARLSRIAIEKYSEQISWYKKYKEEDMDISQIPEEFLFEKKDGEKFVASYSFPVADVLFQNGKKNQLNPNEFLEELKYGDVKLPEKTREIYLYLPLRMMEIFPTIKIFSNIDLLTGKSKSDPFMYYTEYFKDTKEKTILGRGVEIDKKRGMLILGKQKVPIKAFYNIGYTKSGKIVKDVQHLRPKAPFSVIYLSSYQSFLVVDDEMLNSVYIQLFVFENYDKELFEPVILNPWTKVYKVLI